MISCLPSLGLAAFAFFRAFVGGFSAVALMEARDRPAGAAQSPAQPLHPASPNTSVPGSLCLGREMKGNLCQERGRIPPVLVHGTGAFRKANSMSKWGLWITWSHRDVKALQGRLGRDLSTSQKPKLLGGEHSSQTTQVLLCQSAASQCSFHPSLDSSFPFPIPSNGFFDSSVSCHIHSWTSPIQQFLPAVVSFLLPSLAVVQFSLGASHFHFLFSLSASLRCPEEFKAWKKILVGLERWEIPSLGKFV